VPSRKTLARRRPPSLPSAAWVRLFENMCWLALQQSSVLPGSPVGVESSGRRESGERLCALTNLRACGRPPRTWEGCVPDPVFASGAVSFAKGYEPSTPLVSISLVALDG